MFAGCCQVIWAVGKTMWVRGPGYCQLIWAENRDVCRFGRLRLQVATRIGRYQEDIHIYHHGLPILVNISIEANGLSYRCNALSEPNFEM